MDNIPVIAMPGARPGRAAKVPPLWIPIVLVSTSLLFLFLFFALAVFGGLGGTEPGIVIDAPGSTTLTMQAGTVYGIAMETVSVASDNRDFPEISVMAPDGTTLALAAPGTYLDPNLEFVGVVRSPRTADYRVSVGPPPDGDPMKIEVIASPGKTEWIDSAGLLVFIFGPILFLAGVILFIVRAVLLRKTIGPSPI